MRLLRLAGLVAVLAACSPAPAPGSAPPAPPRETPPAGSPAAPRAPGPPAAPAPSPERLAAAEAFGRDLEAEVLAGDVAAVALRWDAEAIAAAVVTGLEGDARKIADFRRGLAIGLGKSIENVVRSWQSQSPKFKRVVALPDGSLHARFRMVGDLGIAVVDLVLDPRADGFRIVDFHNRTLGFSLVEQTRQSSVPILAQLDRGFLARLAGGPGSSTKDADLFAAMAKSLAARDFPAVVAAYRKLSQELRDTAPATSMYVTALQQTGDDAAYGNALLRAAEKFPPPLFRFALVDVHFMNKRWAEAIACVDEFMAATEKDAALLALRAGLENSSGDLPRARETVREALALEPDCAWAHSQGLDVLLASKDWAAVRDSMTFLESTGAYTFRGHMDDPLWKEFLAAPESEAWR